MGHHGRPPRGPGRAGHAAVPLPGDGGTDRRDRPQRGAAPRRGPAADASSPPRTRPRSLDATDLVIFAAPSAHLRTTVERCAPFLVAGGRSAVRRQGPGARHAPADERGDRGRERRAAVADGRPVGSRTSPPRSRATCRRRRSSPRPTSTLAGRVVARLARRRFRLYVNEDILGVELAGALKNVVAIAAGAADGLGFGDNGKAGLLTRGLAEMMRLGIAAGANPLTFAGLAGMGDLDRDLRVAAVAQPSARRGAGEGPLVGRDRGDAAGDGRGRLHGQGRAGAGGAARRRAADRPPGRARAVRGQERAALPRRPARPRIQGRARRRVGLDGAARPRGSLGAGRSSSSAPASIGPLSMSDGRVDTRTRGRC